MRLLQLKIPPLPPLFPGLANERVVGVAACSVRASLWTESGKVATMMDDSLFVHTPLMSGAGSKLKWVTLENSDW